MYAKQKASQFNFLLQKVWKSTVGWIPDNTVDGLCVISSLGSMAADCKILEIIITKTRQLKIAWCEYLLFTPYSLVMFIFYLFIGKNSLYIWISILYYSSSKYFLANLFSALKFMYGMFIFYIECFHFYVDNSVIFYVVLVSGLIFMLRKSIPNPK